MKKELYDISVFFKIFKRFEKVVLVWKNWEKLAKMSKNRVKWLSQSPHIYTTNGIDLYFVNKRLSSWPLLVL